MNHEIEREKRLTALETQMNRVVSDIESDKRARASANSENARHLEKLSDRVLSIEKSIWIGMGGVLAAQIALKYFMK